MTHVISGARRLHLVDHRLEPLHLEGRVRRGGQLVLQVVFLATGALEALLGDQGDGSALFRLVGAHFLIILLGFFSGNLAFFFIFLAIQRPFLVFQKLLLAHPGNDLLHMRILVFVVRLDFLDDMIVSFELVLFLILKVKVPTLLLLLLDFFAEGCCKFRPKTVPS